jgi:hypothetical protein
MHCIQIQEQEKLGKILCFNHKVHIYLEYHSVCPLVQIGTPTISPEIDCVSPRNPRGGGHTRQRVRGSGGPNFDDWRKNLALCLLCGFNIP